MTDQNGQYLYNTSCEDCGSSDALAVYRKYDDDDNEYYDGCCWAGCKDEGKAFKSGATLVEQGIISEDGTPKKSYSSNKTNEKFKMTDVIAEQIGEVLQHEAVADRTRLIKKDTLDFYKCRTEVDDEGKPQWYFFPYSTNGEVSGFKKRSTFKVENDKGKEKRVQSMIGHVKMNESELFGQSLFSAGGRVLVITEGENDALAFYQAMKLNNSRYDTPVVSIGFGAGNARAHVQTNYEWVTSFDKVIIAFDNDDPGNKAAEEVLKLLKPGQGHQIKFKRYKDASDYVQKWNKNVDKVAGSSSALVDYFFKAERYSPAGIVSLSQMWDSFESETSNEIIPFPPAFGKLNEMMSGGMERGEVTTLGALTSIGKSIIVSHVVHYILAHTDYKIGAMYLEGTTREVVRDLLGIDQQVNLRKKGRDELDFPTLRKAFFNGVAKDDRFIFADAQGSLSNDEIFDKFQFLTKGCGVDLLIVDPIQAAIASDSNGATIDFMDKMLKLAKQTNVAVLEVSHMRKPDSDNPHAVNEYSLMGSSAINQISFNTILASRDKMSECPIKRNATRLQLVKCRRTGETGEAGWFSYDNDTTLIQGIQNPYEEPIDNDLEQIMEEFDTLESQV